MRAVAADVEGSVARDGVTVHYARYGSASPTLVLLPTWSLVHSRHWKMQVPYLARHYTVLTFDGRGSGRSDRPASPASYSAAEFAADALAVMDATETECAVLVSVSRGALWSLHLCAEHPERVLGAIFIAPGVPFAPPPLERVVVLQRFDEVVEEPVGWAKFNAHHWKTDYRDFVEFFVGQMFTEQHSTKQIRGHSGLGAGDRPGDIDRDPLWPRRLHAPKRSVDSPRRSGVRCWLSTGLTTLSAPTPQVRPSPNALAGSWSRSTGAGHFPHARDPVRLNLLIRQFVEGIGR